MFTLEPTKPFLSAIGTGEAPNRIVGFPYEATASFRGGSHFAPNAIREWSESIETYSPHQDRDLEDILLQDVGNVVIAEPLALFPAHMDAARAVCASLRAPGFTLFLGGEHTSTLAFLAPDDVADPGFLLLVLDAHLDLRDAYQGTAYSHASWARRALEWLGPERLIIGGARSGTREEFALAREAGLWARTPEEVVAQLHKRRPARIHLSLDIDVLDPAHAPGTGNPEPLGWSVAEVMRLLQALREWHVPTADLVEYSPPHDPDGATGVLAAFLVREMVLALAR